MPMSRRPLAALVTILCLAGPASALYPLGVMRGPSLLELGIASDWLHASGWELHGPVRSVEVGRVSYSFDPETRQVREDEPYATRVSPGRRFGGSPAKLPALEFDAQGRLTYIDSESIPTEYSQIAELNYTGSHATVRRSSLGSMNGVDVLWNEAGTEVKLNGYGGSVWRELRLSRDGQSRVTGTVEYSAEGAPVFREQRTFDGDAEVIVRDTFDTISIDPRTAFDVPTTNERDTIQLDATGRLTRVDIETTQTSRDDNGTYHRTDLLPRYTVEYEHPDEEHVIARVSGSDQGWSQRITLNEHADVAEVEQLIGDQPEAQFKWEYEYDEHGNWTKRTAYALIERFGERAFEPQERIERTITYYDAKAPEPEGGAAPDRQSH